ncbi:MAG: 16S rRNA (cytosine(967)-C(5))-methyltransferase RsmB [Methylophilus sp.]
MYISQQIAAIAVSQVLSGRNLTLALPDAQKQFASATPQQRGAAADLSYGTLRFYGELEIYLNQLLEKPLADGRVHALLLVALYQLLHDRADDFTIVNQAVKAASYAKPKWAKGLVNGVLRNFLRQQDALKEKLKVNEVAQYSYPQWWIDKVKTQYPNDWQNILSIGNQHPPMTLRVNHKKITAQDYVQLLSRQDIVATQVGDYAVMLNHALPVEKIPGFTEGVVSVQDLGAQLVPAILDLQDGMPVLDACCAPGGKTGHILETANVQLTALDNDETRLARVQSNLSRLNFTADLKVGDAATWHHNQLFERILADVPCSASGIVRRHVDIKWLRREADIVSFVQQQSAILLNLWQLLAKGGKLLYVTCSIFNEENQQQIDQFLKAHQDAVQVPIDFNLLQQGSLMCINGQLVPSTRHDGLFYALLQKN